MVRELSRTVLCQSLGGRSSALPNLDDKEQIGLARQSTQPFFPAIEGLASAFTSPKTLLRRFASLIL